MSRGTGATTADMVAAPKRAVYIWVNGQLDYPRRLAREWGREDLRIVTPSWLTGGGWMGVRISGLVVDHAARLTPRQWESLQYALAAVAAGGEGEG